ncbi:Uu.00g075810.m01.CDS01 [Anthostomella pinea]|uniref:Uu.00g075810.m01.CDS01 n=1 Tax=Anthostomella pinea TaxID=933095 RepID=A0AAI8VVR5_9PEZI|nr:Uu.00g075810.m01.CDS01 [Anthostomella pinea]
MDSQKLKYQGVHVDDRDDSSSSTDVEESLMGDEKQWHDVELNRPTRQTKRGKFVAALKSSRWMIDTSLLLIILALLVRDQWRKPAVEETDTWQFGQDMTGFGPRMSQKVTTFVRDESYGPNNTADFFTNETLNRWNDLMPIGMGFQWVNDTHKYHDLPTPIEWPDKTVFTTSATHQLHCLFAIVQTYSGLTSGHEIPDDHHWHMIHCFDYMRQAIMCSADMALEGLETTFPDHNGGSDGWDSKHVCRDWNQVKSYLESVRAYDDQQIY